MYVRVCVDGLPAMWERVHVRGVSQESVASSFHSAFTEHRLCARLCSRCWEHCSGEGSGNLCPCRTHTNQTNSDSGVSNGAKGREGLKAGRAVVCVCLCVCVSWEVGDMLNNEVKDYLSRK